MNAGGTSAQKVFIYFFGLSTGSRNLEGTFNMFFSNMGAPVPFGTQIEARKCNEIKANPVHGIQRKKLVKRERYSDPRHAGETY